MKIVISEKIIKNVLIKWLMVKSLGNFPLEDACVVSADSVQIRVVFREFDSRDMRGVSSSSDKFAILVRRWVSEHFNKT